MRWRRRFLAKGVALVLLVAGFSLPGRLAHAYAYMGSGKWQTSVIRYAIHTAVPSHHVPLIEGAAKWWSDLTDVTLPRQSANKITVYEYDYGVTGWDGIAYVQPGWNSTFQSGNFQLNDSFTQHDPDLRVKLVAAHEFGHLLSLAHVPNDVIMYGQDVWLAYLRHNALANGPQPDDIAGVNARYGRSVDHKAGGEGERAQMVVAHWVIR